MAKAITVTHYSKHSNAMANESSKQLMRVTGLYSFESHLVKNFGFVLFSVCIYQLGMSNRFSIWDNQITASSAHSSLHLKPHMGRLNNPYGSWCIKRRHKGPHYLQIDLGMIVTGHYVPVTHVTLKVHSRSYVCVLQKDVTKNMNLSNWLL